jgi:hypothetical protein
MESRAKMVQNEAILAKLESEYMMYDFPELVEELKISSDYLWALIESLTDEEMFWIPPSKTQNSIAQNLGRLAFIEKELGKKSEIVFSFRLDNFDEFFSDPIARIDSTELPSRKEIQQVLYEVHETLLEEVRFNKKVELVFRLVNQYYHHAAKIILLLKELGKGPKGLAPESQRVKLKRVKGQVPQYSLPVYAN